MAKIAVDEVELADLRRFHFAHNVFNVAVERQIDANAVLAEERRRVGTVLWRRGRSAIAMAVEKLGVVYRPFFRFDAFKEAVGNAARPRFGLFVGQSERVENNRRRIANSHFADFALFDSRSRRGEHNVFFAVGPPAVALFEAAVIRRYDKERRIEHAALLSGVVNLLDISVGRMNLLKLFFAAEPVVVPRHIDLVVVNVEEGRLVLGQVRAHFVCNSRVVVFSVVFIDADSFFDNTGVDGRPAAKGSQIRVGHILANDAKDRRAGTVGRIREKGCDPIGEPVKFGRNAVKHRAPAFGANRRVRGYASIGNSAVCVDFIEIGRFRLLKIRARAVDSD